MIQNLFIYDVLNQIQSVGLLETISTSNSTQMISMAYLTFYKSLFRNKVNKSKIERLPAIQVMSLEKIRKIILEEKLYLNPNLKVKDLAEKLSLPPHVISRMLNSHFNISFNDLINEIRIKYAERLLVSTNDKLYAIALDSGFSNKVSFITNFKKFNKITPTIFRRRVLKRIPERGLNFKGAS